LPTLPIQRAATLLHTSSERRRWVGEKLLGGCPTLLVELDGPLLRVCCWSLSLLLLVTQTLLQLAFHLAAKTKLQQGRGSRARCPPVMQAKTVQRLGCSWCRRCCGRSCRCVGAAGTAALAP
jgi:hypothetical protein